jgi:hypothetical protein
MSKSQMKKMLITFFSITGIIHFEFIPQGQMINQASYVEMLKQLHEAVHRKGFSTMTVLQLTRALSLKQFVVQRPITELDHSLYFPDLFPSDFWLFPNILP